MVLLSFGFWTGSLFLCHGGSKNGGCRQEIRFSWIFHIEGGGGQKREGDAGGVCAGKESQWEGAVVCVDGEEMRITLCGSARFEKYFKEWNKRLTLAGHVVYSIACYPSDNGGKDWYTERQKKMLDEVHFAKIDNSDAIFVIDIDGYIGSSTAREIGHAIATGKEVIYASKVNCGYAGCPDPISMRPPCALCYQ